MIEPDDTRNPIKRSLRRLSTLQEDSQEDNQDIITEQYQCDTSEYEIIESIEGISFMNISMFFYNSSIRMCCVHNYSYDSSK